MALNRLISMGFDRESAHAALIAHDMDVSAAVDSLINGSAGPSSARSNSNNYGNNNGNNNGKGFVANATSMGMSFFQKASSAIQNTKTKLINALESSNGSIAESNNNYNNNNNNNNEQNNRSNPRIVDRPSSDDSNYIGNAVSSSVGAPRPIKQPVASPPKPTKPIVYAPPEVVSAAESIKEKGNVFFKQGNYADAESEYCKAIEMLPTGHLMLVTLSNNRASCRLKTGNNKGAVDDANVALAISENDSKALLRRANAYEALEKFSDALRDYKLLQTIDPNVKGLAQSIGRVSKGLEQMQQEPSVVQVPNSESLVFSPAPSSPVKNDLSALEMFDSLSAATTATVTNNNNNVSVNLTSEDVK